MLDVVILTEQRYVLGAYDDEYSQNVVNEDLAVLHALHNKGLAVERRAWDDTDFDWSSTKLVVVRSTWDYFHRFTEFEPWLRKTSKLTCFVNPVETLLWNMDKLYLRDLQMKGLHIPPTVFIQAGDGDTLASHIEKSHWTKAVLKPAVGGAARHTYKVDQDNCANFEGIFNDLVSKEAMLLQEYQDNITTMGEVSFMLFGGKFSHAVLKKAKPGDFRVQDDFGGTVHEYQPSEKEIEFAQSAIKLCDELPAYARVDVIWDTKGKLAVSELELIEPELWFRKRPEAAEQFAEVICSTLKERL